MKVVYLAGKFRAPHQWGVAENIRAAEKAGASVAVWGAMPMIPHSNTQHFHGFLSDEFFLEGTLELMRRSDAVWLFADSWVHSSGALGEAREAMRLKMPVFQPHQWEQLAAWIVGGNLPDMSGVTRALEKFR